MALEEYKKPGNNEEHVRCTIHHKNDDDTQPKKVNHQFCFPKIDSFFLDPALQVELNVAKKLKEKNERKQLHLLHTIRRLKEKLESLKVSTMNRNYDYRVERLKRSVEFFSGILVKHWPESINENLEEEWDPDLELIEIKDKIPKLTEQLGHGKAKWSAEKQIIKELEHLHRRKELLDREVKEAEARIPKPTKRNEGWFSGSKFDVKREIRGYLKEIREFEKREKDAIMQREQQIGEIEKKLVTLEKKYNIVKQEEEKILHTELLNDVKRKIWYLLKNYCPTRRHHLHGPRSLCLDAWTSDYKFRADLQKYSAISC